MTMTMMMANDYSELLATPPPSAAVFLFVFLKNEHGFGHTVLFIAVPMLEPLPP